MATHSVKYLTPPLESFESTYKTVRNKEGRWLTDNEVKRLPNIEKNHPLEKEWQKRTWILNKFTAYLERKHPKNILDIGCGNGWLTNKASHYCDQITGIDVGQEELEQAARCFGNDTVSFACCSDWSLLPENTYDLIFFSGSFHYFEPNDAFWTLLKSRLTDNGEIHILETKFYSKAEAVKAKKRSEAYFKTLGATVDYYHHLTWDALPTNFEVLYQPDFRNKLFRKRAPFPWVKIRK